MIIKGQHFVLPIVAGKNVGGVTVVTVSELLEKAEPVGDAVIFSGTETEVQPPRQGDQTFLPPAGLEGGLNSTVNRGNENDGQQNHNQDRLQLVHRAFLNQR